MSGQSKFTPQKLGSYTVYPDGTMESHHNWRGKQDKIVPFFLNKDGYYEVRITENGRRRKWKLHKLVCELYHGPKPSPSHQVCHINGDRLDNRAENLRWGTSKENAADRDKHGKTSRGSRHSKTIQNAIARSKMSDALIAAATEMYEELEKALEWLKGLAASYIRDGAYEPHNIITREINRIESVLAKARGES